MEARVDGLDHVNVRTRNPETTRRFYRNVLGLEARDAPAPAKAGNLGWLHDSTGHAVIHLQHLDPWHDNTGAIDHVAFACTGVTAMVGRLDRLGIDYGRFDGLEGRTLLFVTDPNGIRLELNFNEGARE